MIFSSSLLQKTNPTAYKMEQASLTGPRYLVRKSQYEALLGENRQIKNKIVMLGDSITDFGEWHELFRGYPIFNRGISGDTIGGVQRRLSEIVALNPVQIFMMIGINNFAHCFTLEETLSAYDSLLQHMRTELPNTELFLQSVLPIREGSHAYIHNNENIILLNKHIQQQAPLYQARFIDLFSVFLDETGQMNETLAVDGIHLNGAGYLLWKKCIETYLKK